MRALTAATAWFIMVSVLPAEAQDSGRIEIAEAAIAAVIPTYDSAFTGARVKVDLEAVGESRESLGLVADQLGFRPARRAETLDCERPKTPDPGCSLIGAEYMVVVKEVSIQAREARVTIEILGEADSVRQPVWSNGWLVVLTRDRSPWSVTDVSPLWQT